MSETPPQTRIEQALQSDDAPIQLFGTGSVRPASSSKYALIPRAVAMYWDLEAADDVYLGFHKETETLLVRPAALGNPEWRDVDPSPESSDK